MKKAGAPLILVAAAWRAQRTSTRPARAEFRVAEPPWRHHPKTEHLIQMNKSRNDIREFGPIALSRLRQSLDETPHFVAEVPRNFIRERTEFGKNYSALRRQFVNLFPSHYHCNDAAELRKKDANAFSKIPSSVVSRIHVSGIFTPMIAALFAGVWSLAVFRVLIIVFSLRSVLSSLHFTSQQTRVAPSPRRSHNRFLLYRTSCGTGS